jgi:hypothetical protein
MGLVSQCRQDKKVVRTFVGATGAVLHYNSEGVVITTESESKFASKIVRAMNKK